MISKNEILYKISLYFTDLFFPPSARHQKERYLKRYGIQEKTITFYGKGFWTDMCVLHGREFYRNLTELYESPLFKKIRNGIQKKGSFTLKG